MRSIQLRRYIFLMFAFLATAGADQIGEKVCLGGGSIILNIPAGWRRTNISSLGEMAAQFQKNVRVLVDGRRIDSVVEMLVIFDRVSDEDYVESIKAEADSVFRGNNSKYEFTSLIRVGEKSFVSAQFLYPAIRDGVKPTKTTLVSFARSNNLSVQSSVSVSSNNDLVRSKIINLLSPEIAQVLSGFQSGHCK